MYPFSLVDAYDFDIAEHTVHLLFAFYAEFGRLNGSPGRGHSIFTLAICACYCQVSFRSQSVVLLPICIALVFQLYFLVYPQYGRTIEEPSPQHRNFGSRPLSSFQSCPAALVARLLDCLTYYSIVSFACPINSSCSMLITLWKGPMLRIVQRWLRLQQIRFPTIEKSGRWNWIRKAFAMIW